MTLPSVFQYLDYRSWMRACYETKKASQKRYSLAEFGVETGIGDRAFAHGIMAGRRHLPKAKIEQLAINLGLSDEERQYLLSIFQWGTAKSADQRQDLWLDVRSKMVSRDGELLGESDLPLLEKWHYLAVKEVAIKLKPCTAEILSQTMQPRISTNEAHEALIRLLDRGMIAEDSQGGYVEKRALLIGGGKTSKPHQAAIFRNFQSMMMDMAKGALEEIPADERIISAVTVSIPDQDLQDIKNRIQDLYRALGDAAEKAQHQPSRAYQLNIQLFPLQRKSHNGQ